MESAKGTPENPLSPDEVRAKYRRLTASVVPAARAEAIMAAVDRIDRAPDLTGLASLLRRTTGRPRVRGRRIALDRPHGTVGQ